ncbi:PLP-dependent aminotransferase family protein [Kitasatospora sp. NBC_01539]|uniref:MocR-like pyridoxine biosynthesis transcription factor PdxR n=1 Tax=Kitasatospora sp. NBC_01539 TaxID=2903577 RepID=UPI00386020F1
MTELLLAFDRTGGELTARLTRALRDAVRQGRPPAGGRLPATRVLARDLGLARGTVVEAYAQLVAEGYLVSIPGSGTRVADGVAPAAPPAPPPTAGHPVRYDLAPGTPDLSAFPRAAWQAALRRALADTAHSGLGYGDPAGRPELRAALAASLGRVRGAAATGRQVIVVGGVAQGLALLVGQLRQHGHHTLAVEDPCSPGTLGLLRAHGIEPVGVRVDAHGLDVAALAATGSRAVLVTPAHQYPTGVVLAPGRRAALIAWARATGGLVVEDDYDAEFRYDREPVGCLQGLAPDHVVHLGSLSKTLAPGLRLGWAVLPDAWVDGFREAKRYTDLGCSVLDQLAFARLLADGGHDRHLRAVRARYRGRRDALAEALARYLPDAAVRGVAAGLHLHLDLPDGCAEAEVVAAAAGLGVRVEPVTPMRLGSQGAPAVVLGYAALPERALAEAARLLGQAVTASRGRRPAGAGAPPGGRPARAAGRRR